MSKYLKYSLLIALATLLVRFGGFLRVLVLAAVYGAGTVSDAFVIIQTLPNLILTVFIAGTAATYISISANLNEGKNRFTSNLLTVFAVIGILFAILLFLFPVFFIKIFATRADANVIAVAYQMLRYMSCSVVPMLLACVLSANLQANSEFFISTVYQIFINFFLIVSVFVSKATTFPSWMGVGMAVGNFASFVTLVIANRRVGLQYRPLIDIHDPNLKRFFILIAPIMLSSIIVEVDQIVDRNMASSLPLGTVSTLDYSQRIVNMISAFIGAAIGKAIYPNLSILAAHGKTDEMMDQVGGGMKILLPLILPIMTGMILLAEPITRILFERGEFTSADTLRAAQSLQMYALGILAANLTPLLTFVFYAKQTTKVPAILSVVCMLLKVGLNLVLIGPLQHKGLAFSTSISATTSLILLTILLRCNYGTPRIFKKKSEWLKLIIALTIMTVFVWLGQYFMPLMKGDYIKCVALTGLLVGSAILLYGGLLIVLRTEIAGIVLDAVRAYMAGRNQSKDSTPQC